MHADTYKQHLKEVGKTIMYRVIMTIYHAELTQVILFRSKLMVIKVIGTYTFGIKSVKVQHILRVRLSLFFKGHT